MAGPVSKALRRPSSLLPLVLFIDSCQAAVVLTPCTHAAELQGSEGTSVAELMYYNAIISLPFMLALVLLTGEFHTSVRVGVTPCSPGSL
jgi:hypothetical protein